MPGPVAHIFFADTLNPHRNEGLADYFIGTLFPDIRMLGVIRREATHLQDSNLHRALSAPTVFEKGFLIHSWLDETREQFVREKGIYDKLPDGYLTTVALKICEDERLYEQYEGWPQIIEYLDVLLEEEKTFGIAEKDLLQWHHMHQQYFAANPMRTYSKFFASAGYSPAQMNELSQLIDQIQSSNILNTYFVELLVHIASSGKK